MFVPTIRYFRFLADEWRCLSFMDVDGAALLPHLSCLCQRSALRLVALPRDDVERAEPVRGLSVGCCEDCR